MDRDKVMLAVYLILEKDGRVLLLQRDNTGYEDGNWSLPAGHVEHNESAIAAMIREAKEEIGVTIAANDLVHAYTLHRRSRSTDQRIYIDLWFTCNTFSGKVTNMEPEKCSNLLWFEADKLPTNTVDYVRDVLENKCTTNYSELGFE